jgi:hypothetical protein
MIKHVLLAFTLVLFTLPAYALDVSVVDGRAQAGATIGSLTAKINLLSDVVTTNAEQLTRAHQKLTAIDNCAQQDMLYKEGVGCIVPPADMNQLADTLDCVEGEVLKLVSGEFQCSKDTLSQCELCTDTDTFQETHQLSGWMTSKDLSPMRITLHSRTSLDRITTSCAPILPGKGVDLDVDYSKTKKYVSGYTYSGQHQCGGYSDCDDQIRIYLGFPEVSDKKELVRKYRHRKYTQVVSRTIMCQE